MSATALQKAKIEEIAGRLGMRTEWLDAVIHLESNYNPTAKNPYSSARGLIQVIDDTAQDIFGAKNSLELINRYPDFNSQMDNVVLPYFQHRAKYFNNGMPYTNEQQVYMAVFYPIYMNAPADTAFPDSVRKVNPGINTIQDYVNKVNSKYGITGTVLKTSPLLILLAAGAAFWYLTRKRRTVL